MTLGLTLAAALAGAAWLAVEGQRPVLPAAAAAQYRAAGTIGAAATAPVAAVVPFGLIPAAQVDIRSQEQDRTPQRSFARYPRHSGR